MKINLIANLNGALIGLSFGSEREITVGREIGCTIAPLTADGMSRHHAKIYFKDGAWFVEDLGSTNGTYVGDKKVEAPERLSAKVKLQFGRFEVSVDELVDETAAAPAAPAPAPAAPAPAPEAPAAPAAPLAPIPPVEELKPVEPLPPVEELKPAAPMTPAAAAAAGAAAEAAASVPTASRRPTLPIKPGVRPLPAGIKKPTMGGMLKPGLKMPTKPGLSPALKLPPKPTMAAGLKLPPKPTMATGLKLPPKTPAAKPAPALLEPVAELTPLSPIE